MTEAEWLSSTWVMPMLDYLEGKASDRKLMLFSCACIRRIWRLVTDLRSRRYVEVTERFVDGMATFEEERNADESFCAAYQTGELEDRAGGNTHDAVECAAHSGAGAAIKAASEAAESAGYEASQAAAVSAEWSPVQGDAWKAAAAAERRAQLALLRDIFGNPFRPPAPDPSWMTQDVLAVAKAAYDERVLPSGYLDPERLALLSDALLDAGCDDAGLILHLRGEGPHVRGCWAVDCILGKE